MKQLDNLNLADAKSLLRDMRVYADMTKKLGWRGKKLFMKNLLGQKTLRVEYFPALKKDGAWSQAEWVFNKTFWVQAQKEDVEFVENSDLKWGMKIYCDDNMVDLSFKKVEHLKQK